MITNTVTVLAFCMAATVVQGQGEFPIGISPVTIPGTTGECPSDDNRQTFSQSLGKYDTSNKSVISFLTQSHKSVDLDVGEECFT